MSCFNWADGISSVWTISNSDIYPLVQLPSMGIVIKYCHFPLSLFTRSNKHKQNILTVTILRYVHVCTYQVYYYYWQNVPMGRKAPVQVGDTTGAKTVVLLLP